MVSLVNSHINATRIGWHPREIDLSFATGIPPGWNETTKKLREAGRSAKGGNVHAQAWEWRRGGGGHRSFEPNSGMVDDGDGCCRFEQNAGCFHNPVRTAFTQYLKQQHSFPSAATISTAPGRKGKPGCSPLESRQIGVVVFQLRIPGTL